MTSYTNTMSKKKTKFYVVWEGVTPGIYTNYTDCKLQVQGFQGAKYMSFLTLEQAEQAFASSYYDYVGSNKNKKTELTDDEKAAYGEPIWESIAVDAACNGVGGNVEYQGVDTHTKTRLFHIGPLQDGTNNLGEFLALVHGLAYLKKHKLKDPIYSDSITAMAWVRKKKCASKHPRSIKNQPLFELIDRAEKWLRENTWETKILKWQTKAWGEIPADFGRK